MYEVESCFNFGNNVIIILIRNTFREIISPFCNVSYFPIIKYSVSWEFGSAENFVIVHMTSDNIPLS